MNLFQAIAYEILCTMDEGSFDDVNIVVGGSNYFIDRVLHDDDRIIYHIEDKTYDFQISANFYETSIEELPNPLK